MPVFAARTRPWKIQAPADLAYFPKCFTDEKLLKPALTAEAEWMPISAASVAIKLVRNV